MKSILPIALIALSVSAAQANLFNQATDQLKQSADQSLSEAQDDVTDAAAGTLSESTAEAGAKVAQAAEMQSMVAKAVDTSKQLESMLSGNPELQSLLTNSMTSLAQGQDLIALQDLNKLSAAKLTPDQTGLLRGLRSDVEVLALQRNLPASGPVTAATNAIKSGDVTTATTQLNNVLKGGQLNDPQKDLVQTVLQGFGGSKPVVPTQ
ncbi:MAG: hypothetical protein AAFX93_13285 [Verrucomicrobiota bacterium]